MHMHVWECVWYVHRGLYCVHVHVMCVRVYGYTQVCIVCVHTCMCGACWGVWEYTCMCDVCWGVCRHTALWCVSGYVVYTVCVVYIGVCECTQVCMVHVSKYVGMYTCVWAHVAECVCVVVCWSRWVYTSVCGVCQSVWVHMCVWLMMYMWIHTLMPTLITRLSDLTQFLKTLGRKLLFTLSLQMGCGCQGLRRAG